MLVSAARLLRAGIAASTLATASICSAADSTDALIRVGPERSIRTVAEAARLARDGSIVEIDPGDYTGDVAIWTQDRLTLRAAPGGAVRLLAGGKASEGKAIWVVRGGEVTVEGIEFSGARVSDRNGAGIRVEKGQLTVRNCRFLDNENGILTANREEIELVVEGSEFGHNGAGDGQSHNLYAGMIGRLVVTGSHFHHARAGHLLKSRARISEIRYNRLSDESGGRASYELEFPAGGIAIVVGNVLQQSPTTENPHLLAYGAEGYKWPRNTLAVVHNTFIDERSPSGRYFRIAPGAADLAFISNLFVGSGQLDYPAGARRFGDVRVAGDELVNPAAGDYRLRESARNRELQLPMLPDLPSPWIPVREYKHPLQTRSLAAPPTLPGAFQWQ
jgi:hypothetical protein